MSSPEVNEVPEPSVNGGPAFTIDQFIARNPMSRTKFFGLKRSGLGPCMMFNKLISPKAEAAWRDKMERLANSKAAQLERARRSDASSRAGKAAAASPRHVSKHQLGKKRNKLAPKPAKRAAR